MEIFTCDEFGQGWWRIASAGGEAIYGYGSEDEAQLYAEMLDEYLGRDDVHVHHVTQLSDDQVEAMREHLENGDLGINLDDEILSLRQYLGAA